jgi:hypothetical protein
LPVRLYVANVGVNSADADKRGLRSPVFADGRFELIPIKEPDEYRGLAGSPRYRDLPGWTEHDTRPATFVSERLRSYTVHHDPDFESVTYGDLVGPRASRASNLSEVVPGDDLWFVARLWSFEDGRFVGGGDFFLVGRLAVTHNVLLSRGAVEALPHEVRSRVMRNPHWRRYDQAGAEGRVLVGDIERSARFERAIRVTPEVAGMIFGGDHRAADDTYWRAGAQLFNIGGTPRQFRWFGSITRTVQAFLDDSRSADRAYTDALQALARAADRAAPPAPDRS